MFLREELAFAWVCFFFYFCLVKHSLEDTSWPLLYSSSQAIIKLSQSVTAHFMTLMYLTICNTEHVSVFVLQTTWNNLFCTEAHPQAKIDFFKLVPGTLVAVLGLKLEHKPLDRCWYRFPRQREIYIFNPDRLHMIVVAKKYICVATVHQ